MQANRKCRRRVRILSGYGENSLAVHNIGLGSGTVSVRGSGIEEGEEVWVAGRPIPVDENGEFVAEEILPDGAHTVEVAVVDQEGSRRPVSARPRIRVE